MCLAAFVHGGSYTKEEKVALVKGARALGSAFQKVNFLRDLSADFKRLGRSYFPNVNVSNFDEQTKARLVADINEDLKVSAQSLALLPRSARAAVTAAQLLFAELNQTIGNTEAKKLIETRISVGNAKKLWLLAKSFLGAKP
jgi:phytoene/squalene synthetase